MSFSLNQFVDSSEETYGEDESNPINTHTQQDTRFGDESGKRQGVSGVERKLRINMLKLQNQCRLIACVSILGLLFILVIISLVFATEKTWKFDEISENIVSSQEGQNVELASHSNLIIHQSVKHTDKTNLISRDQSNSELLPQGDQITFGDSTNSYTVIQSGSATSFRLSGSNTKILGEKNMVFQINKEGTMLASPSFFPMTGSFIVSDERVKVNITDIQDQEAMQNIMRLRPRQYYYNSLWSSWMNKNETKKTRGFISQEVETVLPNSVKASAVHFGDELVKDFKNLRKEDIITETVGAAKYLFRKSVEVYVYGICHNSDPFGTTASDVPPSARPLCDCLSVDHQQRLNCICSEIATLCSSNRSMNVCNSTNPVVESCSLLH